MPIYEYRCDSCGQDFEKLQKISADPLVDCPECGQPSLRRKVSAAGFRLKGGGWYETDFKSGNKKNLAGAKADGGKADAAGKADSGSKADGGSKPATASDSKAASSTAKKAASGD